MNFQARREEDGNGEHCCTENEKDLPGKIDFTWAALDASSKEALLLAPLFYTPSAFRNVPTVRVCKYVLVTVLPGLLCRRFIIPAFAWIFT